jgi:hypothetical protein
LIRFWLLKLSQTNFEAIDAFWCIINPEFLSVLNQRTGPRKILFSANHVDIHESDEAIPADFAQFICARRIFLHTSLIDEPHRDNLFKFIMGTGNALEKVIVDSNQSEFCGFLVKVKLWKFIFIKFEI